MEELKAKLNAIEGTESDKNTRSGKQIRIVEVRAANTGRKEIALADVKGEWIKNNSEKISP